MLEWWAGAPRAGSGALSTYIPHACPFPHLQDRILIPAKYIAKQTGKPSAEQKERWPTLDNPQKLFGTEHSGSAVVSWAALAEPHCKGVKRHQLPGATQGSHKGLSTGSFHTPTQSEVLQGRKSHRRRSKALPLALGFPPPEHSPGGPLQLR